MTERYAGDAAARGRVQVTSAPGRTQYTTVGLEKSDLLAVSAFRYDRQPIEEDQGAARAAGFGEILHAYTKEEAVLEAQRCLDCAMPFCVQACPITQDCRGYIQLIALEKFDDAARLTIRENPLATVLCKTCYHYCEEDCVMGGKGTPIAIRHLKRAALEFGKSDLLYVASAPRDQRIAVIGAGPPGSPLPGSLRCEGIR